MKQETSLINDPYLLLLFQEMPVPTFIWKKSGYDFILLDYNKSAMELVNQANIHLLGEMASKIFDNSPESLQDLSRCIKTKKVVRSEHDLPEALAGKGRHWIFSHAFIAPDLVITNADEVTSYMNTIKKLQIVESQFRALFEGSTDILVKIDKHGVINDINVRVAKYTGYKKEEFIGKNFASLTQIFPPATMSAIVSNFAKRQHGVHVKPYEIEARHKQGHPIFLEVGAVLQTDENGSLIGEFVIMHDVTKRRQAEEMLRSMSLVDDLTGLHNRRGFFTLGGEALKMARRTHTDALLLYLDIDNMKSINDSIGHPAGDRALVETAKVLRQTFRQVDVIARIGGDEFAVLALKKPGISEDVLISRLEQNLAIINSAAKLPFTLSFSKGIATYLYQSPTALGSLLAIADHLMYLSKAEKNNS